jgi:hypothetical protein
MPVSKVSYISVFDSRAYNLGGDLSIRGPTISTKYS